ncbi:MAG: hypothetical protein K0U98_15720 [Deltaproteobacteria bacterium]|nr:hypothetical protein [Deltaproteobacteria bacterium]
MRTFGDDFSTGSAPEFADAFHLLQPLLVRELKRRGLWEAPPACLGVYGARHWKEPGALYDLAVETYLFIFARGLERLKAQLRATGYIDGLVVINIKYFLTETQKRCDPLGFRVYEVLRLAIRWMVKAGTLSVAAGDKRIRNSTVLKFKGVAAADLPDAEEINEVVTSWCSDLFPDLVLIRGPRVRQVKERLALRISTLREEGYPFFTFKSIMTPLRKDIRGRWEMAWKHHLGDLAIEHSTDGLLYYAQTTRPHDFPSNHSDKGTFQQLLEGVELQINSRTSDDVTKSHLLTLLAYIEDKILTEDSMTPSETRSKSTGALPSNRKLGQILGIPRQRLPDLFQQIRSLISEAADLRASFATSSKDDSDDNA